MRDPMFAPAEPRWIKFDLHIHTLDDPKDALNYSAQELLERAHSRGFRALAITLHNFVFDRPEVFAEAERRNILLIPAAEVAIRGADVVLLNVTAAEIAQLHDFDDLRKLRTRRGRSIFTFAPHPFYLLGNSIGARLLAEIDCFDAIEWCHFYKGLFNPNRRAAKVAKQTRRPLIATSDAHRLEAFGAHYTSMPAPPKLTIENFFAGLREGPLRLTSPPCSAVEMARAIYFIFLRQPWRRRLRRFAQTAVKRGSTAGRS